jgi:hypothetical protein
MSRAGSMTGRNEARRCAVYVLPAACMQVHCEQTGLEAELRFLPTLTAGIRGRCVVDGYVRPATCTDDVDEPTPQV